MEADSVKGKRVNMKKPSVAICDGLVKLLLAVITIGMLSDIIMVCLSVKHLIYFKYTFDHK